MNQDLNRRLERMNNSMVFDSSTTVKETVVKIEGPQKALCFPSTTFKALYTSYLIGSFQPLLNETISSLLKRYQLLGYQLNNALGNLSDTELQKIEDKIDIPEEEPRIEKLKQKIGILFSLTGNVFTADELSLMFNCSIESAEKAIDLFLLE